MLDLLRFKKEFVSLCRDELSESGPGDMVIEERKVNKAQRGMLNGMPFRKEGLNCAPTLYVEDFYKAYKAGSSIPDLSHQAVETVVRSLGMANMLSAESFERLADPVNYRVRLLYKNRNKEYLKDKPALEVGCGLAFIAEIDGGEYGAVFTDALLKETGMSKDELFDKAMESTMRKYPAVLHDLADSVCSRPEDCDNLLEGPAVRAPAGTGPGFVLTNSSFYWGAGVLFYPGVIDRIHELLDGDFYVLPSSVHELIIMADEDQDPQQLTDLVRSANRSVVKDSEILADDLFACRSGKLHRVSFGGVVPACGDNIC